MITDYYAYEKAIGRLQVAPKLAQAGRLRQPMRVLDVGCGYGGVLAGLSEALPGLQGLGIDRDGEMIAKGLAHQLPGIDLITGDFFTWAKTQIASNQADLSSKSGQGQGQSQGEGQGFDVILLRDVLEHIGDYRKTLDLAIQLLSPQGCLYITFAPFQGPFGGHQHNAAGFFAHCPWIHLLPQAWVMQLLALRGNSYKGQAALVEDMVSVFATRLTVAGFEKAAHETGLKLAGLRLYFSRPEYRLKFGIPALALPNWPFLREALATGIEVLAYRY